MRRTYPSTFWKYTTYLLRCYAQINPQRIKDTPAVNLCSRLVSVSSISKGLRKGYCQRGCFKICGYLRCRLTKNSPRRTTSTPAGVFCTLLASASSISKGLRRVCFTICRCCEKINIQRIGTDTDVFRHPVKPAMRIALLIS